MNDFWDQEIEIILVQHDIAWLELKSNELMKE